MNGPWRDELKSQLVTEILKVCPEFLKTVYIQLESCLHPDNSADWRKLIEFLKEVKLKTLFPDKSIFLLTYLLEKFQIIKKQELNIEIGKEQTSVALVTSSFFPTIVQKLIRDHCDDKILHQNLAIRFHIFSLLEICLGKISSFLEQCSPSLTDQLAFLTLKDNVEQFLNKVFSTFILSLFFIHLFSFYIGFVYLFLEFGLLYNFDECLEYECKYDK